MTLLEERWGQIIAWLADENAALLAELAAGRTLDEVEAEREGRFPPRPAREGELARLAKLGLARGEGD